ncbi:ABC transporter ATP-binding protein [Streptomyces griseoviridis]|uniref:ABC transporter ATP-binding protein n=3 Tax=Streptomyces TaxID=1883 RepID=A0A918GTY8_STRGD|nr:MULTISPECIES: ABC transporter ATP-binding protein [Streptomyces]MDP9682713.1 ABC-2 type transport system ATP-binding protein [Streptomyces griseoviridis]GGS58264.1 ABC transporter ATP-binding protein [Streptomyces niveoruber]GGT11092.1 ABC transporter ATP-binding protein [Streptomyces griseoviridis]GGU55221.1 ABC transporter ATP-binding protein [Streptomyces daghestanicus]GHI32342.1 ABC transporter ATP-binding protein [Streptomyces daghestanicus]
MTITVSASGLSLHYGRTRALDEVGLRLSPGVTGLLGPNGAGKTTLLRVLATAVPADRGAFTVLGHDPGTVRGRQEVRRRLGYLPQTPGFHPDFTAFAFVDYVAVLKELTDRRARHREVRRVLEEVGLGDVRGRRIKKLSGGMRQRVALAAALVGDPGFLVLDEPTVGLDPEQRMRFRELIAGAGEGRTVLLSTHQTEDVAMLCRRVLVMAAGSVRFDGTPAELTARAAGRVWRSDRRDAGAKAGWRTGTGEFRQVGDPPEGAELVEPTLEDGYLLVLDGAVDAEVAA